MIFVVCVFQTRISFCGGSPMASEHRNLDLCQKAKGTDNIRALAVSLSVMFSNVTMFYVEQAA